MTKLLTLKNGIPVLSDITLGIPADAYTTLSGATTLFLLPGSISYDLGAGELSVYVDGIFQIPGLDYTETDTTHITFVNTLIAGQTVRVRR